MSESRPRPKLCKKHPYYQAIRKPQVDCDECWKAYVIKNMDTPKSKQTQWQKFLMKMVKTYEEQTGNIVKEVEIRTNFTSTTVVPHAQEKNGKED